jgi:hypothetical protein
VKNPLLQVQTKGRQKDDLFGESHRLNRDALTTPLRAIHLLLKNPRRFIAGSVNKCCLNTVADKLRFFVSALRKNERNLGIFSELDGNSDEVLASLTGT